MFTDEELKNSLPYLEKFSLKLTKNIQSAEDLRQDVILKMLEKRDRFQAGTNFKSWAGKVMFNHFVSQYRHKVKFESKADPDFYIDRLSVEHRGDDLIDAKKAIASLNRLPPRFKDPIILAVLGNSKEEIGDKLGIPWGTVGSRLARGRFKLALANDDYAGGWR